MKGILSDNVQSLSPFLTGITMNEHLLVHNRGGAFPGIFRNAVNKLEAIGECGMATAVGEWVSLNYRSAGS